MIRERLGHHLRLRRHLFHQGPYRQIAAALSQYSRQPPPPPRPSSLPLLQRGVGQTAIATAQIRANESRRPDALFVDPWAAQLAGVEGQELYQRLGSTIPPFLWLTPARTRRALENVVAMRHRFFDDRILWNLKRILMEARPPKLQFVNMAAGLDTRAFRLPFPENTIVYEVEQPEVMEFKAKRLSAGPTPPRLTCSQRHVIAADVVTDRWEEGLLEHGFQKDIPTVWVAEGLLPYLPEAKVMELLQRMALMTAPGGWMGADSTTGSILHHPAATAFLRVLINMQAPVLFGTDDPAHTLLAGGWSRPQIHYIGDEASSYGRWQWSIPCFVPTALVPRLWLMTALRH